MGDTREEPGSGPPGDDGVPDWHSVRAGIEIIASKWTLSVMAELSEGPKRHNELSRALNVDHKQLGRALRRLQQARVVCREADVGTETTGTASTGAASTGSASRTPSVYRLTPAGEDLVPLLAALGAWSERSRGPLSGPPWDTGARTASE
jgi:DNA-binding HxlR family transcriptional regulator